MPVSILDSKRMKELDDNIKLMLDGGASEEDVTKYSDDFVKMFGKKKDGGRISEVKPESYFGFQSRTPSIGKEKAGPLPKQVDYGALETSLVNAKKAEQDLYNASNIAKSAASSRGMGPEVTRDELSKIQNVYTGAQKIKDRQLKDNAELVYKPIDDALKNDGYKNFFKGDTFDRAKATEFVDNVTAGTGAGSYVKTAMIAEMKKRAQEIKDRPEFDKYLSEEMQKTGVDPKKYGQQLFDSLSRQNISNLEDLKNEQSKEADKALNNAKLLSSKQIESFNKFTEDLNKQIESGLIDNNSAVTLYNQEKNKLDASINQIDKEYQKAVRDVNLRINRRYSRIESELKQIEASITDKRIFDSLPQSEKEKIQKAYQNASLRLNERKNEQRKSVDEALGASMLLGKSLTSGLLSGLSQFGGYLNMHGYDNSFSRWLRNQETGAEELAPAQYKWNGTEWTKRAITGAGQSIGASLPTMVPATVLAVASGGLGLPSAVGAAAAGAAGYQMESMQLTGDIYNKKLEETGDPTEAFKVARKYKENNEITLPFYFLGGLSTMKLLQANKLSKVAGGFALEQAEEIPVEYVQNYNEAKESGYTGTFGQYVKENPEIAVDVMVTTIGQSTGMSALGKAIGSISANTKKPDIQYLTDMLNNKGIDFAQQVVRKYYDTGKISQKEYNNYSAELNRLNQNKIKHEESGISGDRELMMSVLSSRAKDLQTQVENEQDPANKEIAKQQLLEVNNSISNLIQNKEPFIVIELPGGQGSKRVMSVSEYQELKQSGKADEVIKSADFVRAVNDETLNNELQQTKERVGFSEGLPDGSYKNPLYATQVSKQQQQESLSEGGVVQPARIETGQPEVGQGEGIQGQATATETNVGNRNILSQEEIDARKSDIERRRKEELDNFNSPFNFDRNVEIRDSNGNLIENTEESINAKYDAELAALENESKGQAASTDATLPSEQIEVTSDATNFASQMESAMASLGSAGVSVTPYTQEKYDSIASQGGKFLRAAGNKILSLLKPNGEIVSLVKDATVKTKGAAQAMISKMKDMGGLFMDNYDIYLTDIYKKSGYKVVARVPFNEKQAPIGWDAPDSPLKNRPDVVFMVREDIAPANEVPFNTYEEAQAYTQKIIDQAVSEGRAKLPSQVESEKAAQPATPTPSVIEEELRQELGMTDVTKRSIAQRVASTVEVASKALRSLGIRFIVVENDQEAADQGMKSEQGIFDSGNGVVVINKSRLGDALEAGVVVWHEAVHPVMNIIRNTDRKLYDMFMRGMKEAAGMNEGVAKAKEWADGQPQYETQEEKDDEAGVDTIARISAGVVDLSNIPTSFKQSLFEMINKIAKLFGIGPLLKDTSDLAAFKRLATEISKAMTKGADVAEIVGRGNVKDYVNNLTSPEVVGGGEIVVQASVSRGIDVYKSREVEDLPRRSLEDIYNSYGGKAVVINSDPTRVGELTLPSGKKIFMYGGPAYLSIKDNVDSNIGFATTQLAKVAGWVKYNAEVFGTEQGVTMVATQAPTSILSNSYALRYVMDGISMLPKSILRSSDFKSEFFGKDLVLLKDAFGEKAYNEFVNKYKKADLSNPEVIDEMISEMAYKVGDDNKPASFKARGAFVSNLLGGITPKASVKGVEGDIGYVSKKPNKFIAKQLMDRLGINAEKVMREIGEPSLVDLYMNEGMWGMAVTGFESVEGLPQNIVDASNELAKDPDNKKKWQSLDDAAKEYASKFQEGGVKHPLFNAKFPGKNAFILDGAYEINKMFKPVEMTGPKGGAYTKTAAQMLAGSMYVKGQPVGAEGSFEYTPVSSTAGAIQASAGGRNLVQAAKLDKMMTEDGQGNYVFFHYSGSKFSKLDPDRFGSNLVTGRGENPGVGLSMMYTEPGTIESGIPSEFGYAIKVPMEKVYPFNRDPLNLYDEAEVEFRKVYGDRVAFDANKQVGFITQVAAKKGYPVTVAEWYIGGRKVLRAQTTEKLPVEVYGKGVGNVVNVMPKFEGLKSNRQASAGGRGINVNESGKTIGFFSDVVKGISDKYKPIKEWKPVIGFDSNQQSFKNVFDKYMGNFDLHIATSIPTFRETQVKVGNALVSMFSDPPRAVNSDLENIKNKYKEANQIKTNPAYTKVDANLFREISDYHKNAKDDRKNPEMAKSYEAFLNETLKQYQELVDAGYKIEPWLKDGEPYGVNSSEMRKDVLENKHLYYLRSRSSTGEANENESAENYAPFRSTGIVINGDDVLFNDLFRAVHDIFGHAMVSNTFSTQGEFDAYNTHSPMYSEKAQKALFLETVVYNAYYSTNKSYAPRKIYDVPNRFIESTKPLVYDIGGSEGGFVKAITESSGGSIKTINLDPNPDMREVHEAKPVEGSKFVEEAFYEGFDYEGKTYKKHKPKSKSDIVHESMVFQFITDRRDHFVKEIADNYLKNNGLFVTEEKFSQDAEVYNKNEKKKSAYKDIYYTKEQQAMKSDDVLVGMKENQANIDYYKNVLLDNFKHVVQYWDSGNFKGFAASNSKEVVDNFVKKVGSTTSEFSTEKTPNDVSIQASAGGRNLDKIISDAKANGTYMKAPNGKPTNLNERQWAQVRTPEFKNWFGDWENDPENASKVVDENGEPMVVYHGTKSKFDQFEYNRISWEARLAQQGPGFYMTDNKKAASEYGNPMNVFTNLLNPLVITVRSNNITKEQAYQLFSNGDNNWFYDSYLPFYTKSEGLSKSDLIKKYVDDMFGVDGSDKEVLQNIKRSYKQDTSYGKMMSDVASIIGSDGVIEKVSKGLSVYVAFNPNQIKSATENTGAFSTTDNRIQASAGPRPEQTKQFKLAAYVMRKISEGADKLELITGIASVMPEMSPQDIKDLIDDPEGWLRNQFPAMTVLQRNNLVERAKLQNIYRNRQFGKPIDAAFTGLEVPMDRIQEYLEKNKISDRASWAENFKKKWFDPAKGLPDWVLAMKDFAGGAKNIEIARAARTVEQLKIVAKSINFSDWDTFSKALKDARGVSQIMPNEVVLASQPNFPEESPSIIPPSIAALPAEIVPFVYKMRGQIDNLTKDLVGSGYVTPEQSIVLQNNIGAYVNRSYRMFNDSFYKPSKEVMNEAIKYLADQYIKQMATDKAGMLTLEQIERDAIVKAQRDVEDILNKNRNPYFNAGSVDKRNPGILKERKDIPEPIRKLMGEYTDPGIVFMMTVTKQAALKSSSQFLSNLRDKGMGTLFFEKNDPERPASHSVQIASTGTESMSPLGGLYTTPEIYESLQAVEPTYNNLTNAWMRMVGAVRYGKTVLSLATQLKNIESNLGFAVMNGIVYTGNSFGAAKDSWAYVKGQYSKSDIDEITEKVIRLNLVGQSVGAREIASMLSSGDVHDIALDMALSSEGMWKKRVTKRINPFPAFNKAYRIGDDFWKVYGYINERELVSKARFGGTYSSLTEEQQAKVDLESSERVKNTWPTYDRVWEGAKFVSKNAPIFGDFISFQAESLRVLANTIKIANEDIKDPEMRAVGMRRMAGIAAYLGFRSAVTIGVAKLFGFAAAGILGAIMGDDDEERRKNAIREALPPFMRTGDLLIIPSKTAPHKYTVLNLSSLDPYGLIPSSMNALTEGREGIFGRTMDPGVPAALAELFSPFLGPEMTFDAMWSLMQNRNLKTGNNIVLETDGPADAFDKSIAYTWSRLKPSTYSMIERLIKNENKSAEAWAIIGARPYEVDLHEAWGFALSRMYSDMDGISREYNAIKYNKKYTPEEIKAAQEEAESKKEAIISRYNKLYQDFILTGADPKILDEQINERSAIRVTGFDKQTKIGIKTGKVKKGGLYK
jgi:hypothetical protein